MEAGRVRLLVAASVQVSAPGGLISQAGLELMLGTSMPPAGIAGSLRVCLGLAWCGLRRVRQGRSSSAGIGRVGHWHVGADGWLVRGLVPAAAGVRARLARGEVFGSHAGGVLEERGKEGPGSGGFLGRAEQPAASLMWSLVG